MTLFSSSWHHMLHCSIDLPEEKGINVILLLLLMLWLSSLFLRLLWVLIPEAKVSWVCLYWHFCEYSIEYWYYRHIGSCTLLSLHCLNCDCTIKLSRSRTLKSAWQDSITRIFVPFSQVFPVLSTFQRPRRREECVALLLWWPHILFVPTFTISSTLLPWNWAFQIVELHIYTYCIYSIYGYIDGVAWHHRLHC